MVEKSCGISIPAVLYDGKNEIDIGCVVVTNSTRFQNFQSSIGQIIGISPHQFSIFLLYNDESMIRRKIPVTSKFDFGTIHTQNHSIFLVVLKRSKRERRRKSISNDDEYQYSPAAVTRQPNKKSPPENVMILRRNSVIDNHNQPFSGFIVPTEHHSGYDQRIRNLHYERQKYLMTMGMNGLSALRDVNSSAVICEECLKGSNTATNGGFHLCVYDPVAVGFRTLSGPIARPGKRPE